MKWSVTKSLICLFVLNHVSGHRIVRDVDEENKPLGCKYVSLANGESILFKKDTGNLEHTTMALLSTETPKDVKPKFEMHFAAKSASNLRVLMFTRQQYESVSRTNPDYKVSFGVADNKFSQFFYTTLSKDYHNYQFIDLKNSSQILSPNEFKKYYVTITDDILKYGQECAEPIGVTENLGFYRPEIVQMGFQSEDKQGAKIYYDCPKNFADC